MTLDEMLEEIKPKSPTVLLSFSRGKDAWGCWCALRDKIDIQPFHYYGGIPNLSFVDEYLDYAERKIGKKIINVPSPTILNCLSPQNFTDMPPNRYFVLQEYNLKSYSFTEMQKFVMEICNLPQTTYTALGVRACDSARRALFFKSHGPITRNRLKFYPIWDWNKDKLIEELKRHDVKLPIDYKMFGRTLDGEYYMYLVKIREHYPEDYKRMLEYYPLIDKEIYRYEKRQGMGY